MTTKVLDLSQELRPGLRTHPGLPAPEAQPYRTREGHQASSGTTSDAVDVDELADRPVRTRLLRAYASISS